MTTETKQNIETEQPIWRDYLELCKPNVVALMILTSVIGMLLAVPGMVPWKVMVFGNLGIALCAGAAAAVNHIVDRHVDLKMARTFNRPVAKGRVSPQKAIAFAVIMGGIGLVFLLVFANITVAWLTLASLLGYAVVYTLYLKRATPQNIVIGGLAGAAPPLLGWVAVTGEIHGHALLLVLIIYAWTPPHFWALAIHRKKEYANAKIPMLPVTHGEEYTKLHILLYSIILVIVTLLPFVTGMMNWFYLAGASILGIIFIYYALLMMFSKKPDTGMAAFRFSIIYLMVLFVVMLIDHYAFPVSSFMGLTS